MSANAKSSAANNDVTEVAKDEETKASLPNQQKSADNVKVLHEEDGNRVIVVGDSEKDEKVSFLNKAKAVLRNKKVVTAASVVLGFAAVVVVKSLRSKSDELEVIDAPMDQELDKTSEDSAV